MAETKNTEKQEAKLPEDVSRKFQLKGLKEAGMVYYNREHIDMSKLTMEKAAALAADEKFPYLTALQPASSAAVTAPAGEKK